MKRKILVSLLAMTLALSLMPVMTFADNETDDPAPVVNETKTDAEDEFALKAKISKVTNGNKSVLKSRNTAVLKAPKTCDHPLTSQYEVYEFYEEECTIIDRGDYHDVTGMITVETYCGECDALLNSETKDTTVHEQHYYVDGVCIYEDCGHVNTCTHPSTEHYYYYYDDEDLTIIDRGDYHEVTGWVDLETYCAECGEYLYDEDVSEYMTIDEEHSFDSGGTCEECGHLNDETRQYGSSRYDTAVTVANRYLETLDTEEFENVIVAYGLNYPDALSGGYLAKVKNAPIILVQPSVEDYIVNYIDENIANGGTVYILGGTGVVRQAFEDKIRANGIKSKRLWGPSRYETNLEILKEAGVDDEELLVCTGTGFADSLSASAVGKPILLVDDSLTDAQKDYIQSLSTEKFYLIGGEGAVGPEIETNLIDLGYSKDNIKRLWGPSRYETSTAVAEEFFKKTDTVVLAYAMNFPDGLSGGPLAMKKNAPIILTDSRNTEAAKAYVKKAGATSNFTLGGPSLISDIAVEAIMGD